jgi:hypothetical protein
MIKPIFMSLHQGGVEIAVNMSLVAYIAPNNPAKKEEKSVIFFSLWAEGEPIYLVVDESLDEIASRKEWDS